MTPAVEVPSRPKRKFLPEDYAVSTWELLKPFFENLANRTISNVDELKQWLRDRSELESVISEDMGWRYIRMTCYTDKEEYSKAYQDFVQNIQPQIAPYSDSLNKKTLESPFIKSVEKESGYNIMVRNLKKEVELFRSENIPLFTEMTTQTQKYAEISGAMTVEVNGKEMTLPQAVWIGACQILSAVFPGTSRSMSTIAGGQLARMSRTAALEFSFFLSIPTMIVAVGYDLLKSLLPGREGSVSPATIDAHGWIILAIGFVVSFIVALGAVRWFMGWVEKRGLLHFAGYRIFLGIMVLIMSSSI